MSLIELNKISRFYQVGKDKKKYVLKDVTLSFPDHGLISILGKSGSGKSTLLNLIGKIDKPSEGSVYFNNENISKYKEKKMVIFHSQVVSYIFQHYHLLEKHSAIFNVMLPALISGEPYQEALKKATDLLNDFMIDESLFRKRCADLSGGEKERIAILRAFINKPQVILADEPTGALDKNNALLTMKTLKKISQESLVILVTHNASLAEKYSDRIIKMSDGKVVEDKRINNTFNRTNNKPLKKNRSNQGWIRKIITTNFAKRFKRNIFSIVALVVGLVASMLIFGFSNGKDASIVKSMEKQFDYGTASISKENRLISNDSPIALIQTMRPNEQEIEKIKETCTEFHIYHSYDSLINAFPTILINEMELESISYNPIHSFVDQSVNHDLLIKGKIPTFDTLNQVVINNHAYQLLNKKLKHDCLNSYLRIKEEQHYSFSTDDMEKPYVEDYFTFDRLVQIVGVIGEINFLNTPKVYYSFLAMDKYMSEAPLNNLSIYKENMSWKDAVIEALDKDPLSSYSYRLFLKEHSNIDHIKNINDRLGENFKVTCNGLTVEETLVTLIDAASVGMEVFLGIALVGIVMILGIIAFASYNEDIKDSAILFCCGARRDDIAMIHISESLLIGLISVVIAFVLGSVLVKPINLLIQNLTSLIGAIKIPFKSFKGRFLLFPIAITFITAFVCIFATYLPILFSKKISLKDELKEND